MEFGNKEKQGELQFLTHSQIPFGNAIVEKVLL